MRLCDVRLDPKWIPIVRLGLSSKRAVTQREQRKRTAVGLVPEKDKAKDRRRIQLVHVTAEVGATRLTRLVLTYPCRSDGMRRSRLSRLD